MLLSSSASSMLPRHQGCCHAATMATTRGHFALHIPHALQPRSLVLPISRGDNTAKSSSEGASTSSRPGCCHPLAPCTASWGGMGQSRQQPRPVQCSSLARGSGAGGSLTPASPAPARADVGNGVFLLMLVNVVLFIADKLLHLPGMQALYLHHAHPQIWQWATHLFMHANWQHLSGNLFFLLTFGRMVEETEGASGIIFTYFVCGLGAALASFLLSPRYTVSVGASGAIFGLFAVSVLSRLAAPSLRRLLESVVLGNFVLKQVLDEVGHQVRGGLVMGGLHVSHIAHLGGALAGVLLVALLQRLPQPKDE